ncbi:helix-turn-helix domain-containing protein [Halomicroarcula limicola]|uniref:Helix-turn-helix domain-containing protein n=1 Tax=Haloarcula limicola TaxID=1429915 RepID=A0A8J8C8A0_9EURY|nr:helix-turn-helix domain-containing protein [Halomicroarcula limicola]MBV0925858.1 helix-turn-helix domain-containing protein [Halomicroarcula limicola]
MGLVVEFAVGSPGRCPVAEASERAGERVTDVARTSLRGDGAITEEFRLPAHASVEETIPDLDAVATTESETIYRFERDAASDCVCEVVERIAGPATDVRAEDGTLFVTVVVEELATVRTVVERLRAAFDGVRVRRLTAAGDTDDAVASLSGEGLTGRQREVVRTAYEMGYFEYPKGANAGDVADALGICRSTFAEHVAAAIGKLFEARFDADAVTPTAARR